MMKQNKNDSISGGPSDLEGLLERSAKDEMGACSGFQLSSLEEAAYVFAGFGFRVQGFRVSNFVGDIARA